MPFADKTSQSNPADAPPRWSDLVVVGLAAVGLTYLFWFPLWHGCGLIGGDLYPYYFPQKQFLVNALREGQVPLWNQLVGLGYPVLAESQTGALYPPHLLLYSLFDMNTAYNVNQLLHYVAAFAGTWMLGRTLGLSRSGAMLAAVVYVYGWFPARICLEWAIIGGAYQPWMLWMLVRFRHSGHSRYLSGMALLLGLHLLAGHYNLAFITLLLMTPLAFVPGLGDVAVATDSFPTSRRTAGMWTLIAIMLGFVIAGVQLVPSWELKELSQRSETGESFAPGYGHLPPLAITQLVAPWLWHGPQIDADQALAAASAGTIPAITNKAEAWVYAGTMPILLVLYGWLKMGTFSTVERRRVVLWSSVAIVSLLFATGWPIVFLSWAPGFSFFMGPGRYTILTTLAIGIIAATVLDSLLTSTTLSSPKSNRASHFICVAVIALTVGDLWAASREYQFGAAPFFGRQVFYASLVNTPPIRFVGESSVKSVLDDEPFPPRIYAPGPNVATLTGHSAIPVYLGIGPKAYVEHPLRFDFLSTTLSDADIQIIVDALYELGVTHLLLEHPLEESRWPVEVVFVGHDPLINRVFGRQEPYWFYRLPAAPGRVRLKPANAGSVTRVVSEPQRTLIEVNLQDDAEATLVELAYPGWTVTIDGRQAVANPDAYQRSVRVPAGEHVLVWTYQPRSVWLGAMLSACGLLGTGVLPWILRRRTVHQTR